MAINIIFLKSVIDALKSDILKGMASAFDDGMRSVVVTFTVSGKEYGYQYHFSKVSH